MNEAFTPGPWQVDDLGYSFFYETNHLYGIGAQECLTYRIAKIEGMGSQSLANARLIAAAPDLLAALEDVIADRMVGLLSEETRQSVRHAIEKASRGI